MVIVSVLYHYRNPDIPKMLLLSSQTSRLVNYVNLTVVLAPHCGQLLSPYARELPIWMREHVRHSLIQIPSAVSPLEINHIECQLGLDTRYKLSTKVSFVWKIAPQKQQIIH